MDRTAGQLLLPMELFESSPVLTPTIQTALEEWSHSGNEERGAIFTRLEVVDFILDLVGYTEDRPLYQQKLLEPSFGNGDFLFPALDRLLASYRKKHKRTRFDFEALKSAVIAIELHRQTFKATRDRLLKKLSDESLFSEAEQVDLSNAWLRNGDFLLEPLAGSFDFVVGNPPYVRQESIPTALLTEYRRRYATLFDRADLYVPFIERSLNLLCQQGSLGFICADRWMKNRYGGPLRAMIASAYRLKYYVDMVGTNAFHSEVSAYPAITIITRASPGPTRVAHRPQVKSSVLTALAKEMKRDTPSQNGPVQELCGVGVNGVPWILNASEETDIVRRLESQFPTLEQAGCKVGIGVATGADKVFIGPYDSLNVEPSRKLPLVMTKDLQNGTVQWRGLGVINPFHENGSLVLLNDYPKLATYLESHKAAICRRHVAQRNPIDWYRTIDRITPSIARVPKLLIPDIKGEAHIVYEGGELYPHHNLYFITAEEWDLKALQALLLSGVARLFVGTYSTQMRGGYLRFQAQYLRKIRLPRWADVPCSVRDSLIQAAESGDDALCKAAVCDVYGFTKREREVLSEMGDR